MQGGLQILSWTWQSGVEQVSYRNALLAQNIGARGMDFENMKATTLFHSVVNAVAPRIHMEKNQKRSEIYNVRCDKEFQ